MYLQKPLEERRAAAEGVDDCFAETGRAVHEEKAARHDAGEALDTPVSMLVEGEIVRFERRSERGGLTEAECEAFAGDGVD